MVYEVTVGNIGKVLTTETWGLAHQWFYDYTALALSRETRADLPVVLWANGEPIAETE